MFLVHLERVDDVYMISSDLNLGYLDVDGGGPSDPAVSLVIADTNLRPALGRFALNTVAGDSLLSKD